MRTYLVMITAALGLMGCAAIQDSGSRLTETQMPLTAGCTLCGIVSETADADRVSSYLARHAMVRKVERRAVQLGATHIVWLHKTDTSATAEAYRCPDPRRD